MPFHKDPGDRESELYCSLCFKKGEFTYKGTDLKEFKQYCYNAMIERGMNKYQAKVYTFFNLFRTRLAKKKPTGGRRRPPVTPSRNVSCHSFISFLKETSILDERVRYG